VGASPPRRTIRVVLFGSEEPGLFGGKAYAEAHKAELDHFVVAAEPDFGQGPVYRFQTGVANPDEPSLKRIRAALAPLGVRVTGVQEHKLDVSGYDPDVFCEANFFGEWETRSYMASIVSSGVSKIINVPTMKDHSAAGVTGCLKNLGYGTFNNVDRSHRRPFSFTDPLIGIMCSVEPLRSKAVLHIMDGTRMVWHGGPLTQNRDFIFPAGLIMVGTDPVAMDTIELEKIEAKRRQEGAPSVWSRDPQSLTNDGGAFYQDASKNLFYRQPHHIAAAGKLGLGISDRKQIEHQVIHIA